MRGICKDGRGHAPDLVIRQGVIGTQRRGMGSKTGCKHVFLLTWLLKKTAHRIPRFGAQPFGCSVRSARGTRLALLPPSFLSSSPATVRSARTGAVKEASAGLVRPAAQRGHGPARLDGARERATVADKVMKSGETAGQGNGLPHAPTARQAKRAGPKLEAGPEASAEQREGMMEARQGRNPAGGSMRSTTARPAMFPGRGRPDFKARCTSSCSRHREAGSIGPAAAVVWPIRRSRFGGL